MKSSTSSSLVVIGQESSSPGQSHSSLPGMNDTAHGCAIDELQSDSTLPAKSQYNLFPSKRAAGYAAEYLVLSDLLSQGFKAFPTLPDMNYDILVDLGSRFVRVQVKSTIGPSRFVDKRVGETYRWITRPGKDSSQYCLGDFDMFALVAMDIGKIAYISAQDTINQIYKLSAPGTVGSVHKKFRNIDQYPFTEALSQLKKSA